MTGRRRRPVRLTYTSPRSLVSNIQAFWHTITKLAPYIYYLFHKDFFYNYKIKEVIKSDSFVVCVGKEQRAGKSGCGHLLLVVYQKMVLLNDRYVLFNFISAMQFKPIKSYRNVYYLRKVLHKSDCYGIFPINPSQRDFGVHPPL